MTKYYINEAKKLISPDEAEREGFAVPKEDTEWATGEFKTPTKKAIGYKLFGIKNNDASKLYPPVVANKDGKPTPTGVWLPCYAPPIVGYTVKEHRPQVKTGGKGTMKDLGDLAFRPGWHLGVTPYAPQFFCKLYDDEKLVVDGKYVMTDDLVFAECEYQADNDFSEESYNRGLSKNGVYSHSRAGIPRIPKNGYYRYRTNPVPDTTDWIITGAIKVIKILKPEEVNEINKKNGLPEIMWVNKKDLNNLKQSIDPRYKETNIKRREDKKRLKDEEKVRKTREKEERLKQKTVTIPESKLYRLIREAINEVLF